MHNNPPFYNLFFFPYAHSHVHAQCLLHIYLTSGVSGVISNAYHNDLACIRALRTALNNRCTFHAL